MHTRASSLFLAGAVAIADYSGFRNSGNLDYTPTRGDRDEMLESCAGYNVLYYNPTATYTPWTGVDINGNAYQDQSITAALNDPYNPGSGSRDLTNDEGFGDPPGYMVWTDDGDGVFEQGECPDVNDADYDYINQFVATVAGFGPTQVMTPAEQTNFAKSVLPLRGLTKIWARRPPVFELHANDVPSVSSSSPISPTDTRISSSSNA